MLMLSVAAHDFFRPDEFIVRCQHFSPGAYDEPDRDCSRDQWVKNPIASADKKQPCQDRGKRYPYIAKVMDVGQADRSVVLARLAEQIGHSVVRRSSSQTHDHGNEAHDRRG